MLTRVGVAVVVEIGYAVFTRGWLASHTQGIERELAITAVRAATIPVYWMLFRTVIRSRRRGAVTTRHPLLAFGLVLILVAPALTDERLPSLTLKLLFAATSVVVGVREELVYRGVLQTLLEPRCGWIGAIVVSNVVFTAYHYRAFDFTVFRVTTILLVGGALGLIYYGTGSLRLPILLHAGYDAVAALTPLVPQPVSPLWTTALQLAGIATLVVWVTRTRRVEDRASSDLR